MTIVLSRHPKYVFISAVSYLFVCICVLVTLIATDPSRIGQTASGKMSAFRQIPRSQYNVVLKERVMFHVISDEHERGMHFHAPKPEGISFEPPAVTKPAFPTVTQTSLKVMQPGIFFVEYDCDKHCRSLGICVHYQFVIGSKKCPDGLMCEVCKQGVEQLVCHSSFSDSILTVAAYQSEQEMSNALPSRRIETDREET